MLNPGDPAVIEAVDAHIAQRTAPVRTVVHLGESFLRMPRADGATTCFWTIVSPYSDELALKLENGTGALMDALDAPGVDDIV